MEKVWNFTAIVCTIVAIVFFWFHNFDLTFVTSVIGAVTWLLGFRAQTKKRNFNNAQRNLDNHES